MAVAEDTQRPVMTQGLLSTTHTQRQHSGFGTAADLMEFHFIAPK